MWQYALTELFWVCLVLGTPVLIAIAWTKYHERKRRMLEPRYIIFEDNIERLKQEYKAKQRQKLRDDHIFNTVKEWRNDVA